MKNSKLIGKIGPPVDMRVADVRVAIMRDSFLSKSSFEGPKIQPEGQLQGSRHTSALAPRRNIFVNGTN